MENDSILMAYYKKCKANLDSPIALDMCDTLFVRSEKAGNRRLMAIAKCLKLDYYYYKNDEENILKSVKEAIASCAMPSRACSRAGEPR